MNQSYIENIQSLSVGEPVKPVKQLKVQNLCPPSHCPKHSSGPDLSLFVRPVLAPVPYV